MFSVFSWQKKEFIFLVGVISLIFGVSFYQLQTSKMKTRDTQRRSDTELVGRAIDAYFLDHQTYPAASVSGAIVSCGSKGLEECEWGEGKIVDEDNVTYLERLPREPFFDQGYKYIYEVSSDRKHYRIYSVLEYTRDPAYRKDLNIECGPGAKCGWYVEH